MSELSAGGLLRGSHGCVLTAHVERIIEDLHRERAERHAAEARAANAADAADELRERERELAEAGFFARRRMIRDLRRQPA